VPRDLQIGQMHTCASSETKYDAPARVEASNVADQLAHTCANGSVLAAELPRLPLGSRLSDESLRMLSNSTSTVDSRKATSAAALHSPLSIASAGGRTAGMEGGGAAQFAAPATCANTVASRDAGWSHLFQSDDSAAATGGVPAADATNGAVAAQHVPTNGQAANIVQPASQMQNLADQCAMHSNGAHRASRLPEPATKTAASARAEAEAAAPPMQLKQVEEIPAARVGALHQQRARGLTQATEQQAAPQDQAAARHPASVLCETGQQAAPLPDPPLPQGPRRLSAQQQPKTRLPAEQQAQQQTPAQRHTRLAKPPQMQPRGERESSVHRSASMLPVRQASIRADVNGSGRASLRISPQAPAKPLERLAAASPRHQHERGNAGSAAPVTQPASFTIDAELAAQVAAMDALDVSGNMDGELCATGEDAAVRAEALAELCAMPDAAPGGVAEDDEAHFVPVGFNNPGVWCCYISALQALLATAPFRRMLRLLHRAAPLPSAETVPLLSRFSELASLLESHPVRVSSH
jgi:hypothetical protein